MAFHRSAYLGTGLSVILAITTIAVFVMEDGTNFQIFTSNMLRFQTGDASVLTSSAGQPLGLVSKYAETFRNREEQQNYEYHLAEKIFEERNQQYMEAVAAYQKKRAELLEKQAKRLANQGNRLSGKGTLRRVLRRSITVG